MYVKNVCYQRKDSIAVNVGDSLEVIKLEKRFCAPRNPEDIEAYLAAKEKSEFQPLSLEDLEAYEMMKRNHSTDILTSGNN